MQPSHAAGAGDRFGTAVAAELGSFAVGAPLEVHENSAGAVHVYNLTADGQWHKHQTLTSEGLEEFGTGLTFASGDLIVGAPDDHLAVIYRREGDSYVRSGVIEGTRPYYWGFGRSMSADGTRLVIGANGFSSYDARHPGSVTVFDRGVDGIWTQKHLIVDPELYTGYGFGEQVALAGDSDLVVSAPRSGNGVVRRYRLMDGVWNIIQEIRLPLEGHRNFGSRLAICQNYLFVSSLTSTGQGYVHIFRDTGSSFAREGFLLEPVAGFAKGGLSAKEMRDGLRLVVGAPLENVDGRSTQGAAYIYKADMNVSPATWVLEKRVDQGSNGRAGDRFASSIALDETGALIAGAPLDDSEFIDQGTATIFEYAAMWMFSTRVSSLTP
jgi:hypothetical protein